MVLFCSVLFFSRPRSEGWPHRRRTFSIYILSSDIQDGDDVFVLNNLLCFFLDKCGNTIKSAKNYTE